MGVSTKGPAGTVSGSGVDGVSDRGVTGIGVVDRDMSERVPKSKAFSFTV